MPDLNPIDYLLAIAVVACIGLGIYAHHESSRADLCDARYSAFVAETKAAGVQQETEGKELNQKHEQSKKDADNEITLARGNIAFYAEQLRQSAKNTGGSLLPPAAASAGSSQGTCFDTAGLTAAMGEYSQAMGRIRQQSTELVIEGAQAVVGLDGSKKWAQEIK